MWFYLNFNIFWEEYIILLYTFKIPKEEMIGFLKPIRKLMNEQRHI